MNDLLNRNNTLKLPILPAVARDGSQIGATSQRRRGQGSRGGALEGGGGSDGEMDRAAIADGSAGLCSSTSVSPAEG